jgi:hypothetical protein
MAAPTDSLVVPGRPAIWLNPVVCGVALVGVLGALLDDEPEAMPLYLWLESVLCYKIASNICSALCSYKYFISTSSNSLPPGDW